jgi:hypothetical protein
MMFVCYSVALGALSLAYHWPEVCLLVVMVLLARR